MDPAVLAAMPTTKERAADRSVCLHFRGHLSGPWEAWIPICTWPPVQITNAASRLSIWQPATVSKSNKNKFFKRERVLRTRALKRSFLFLTVSASARRNHAGLTGQRTHFSPVKFHGKVSRTVMIPATFLNCRLSSSLIRPLRESVFTVEPLGSF